MQFFTRFFISILTVLSLSLIANVSATDEPPKAVKKTSTQVQKHQEKYQLESDIEATFFIEPVTFEQIRADRVELNARLVLTNHSENTPDLQNIYVGLSGGYVDILRDTVSYKVDGNAPIPWPYVERTSVSFKKQLIIDFKVKTRLYSRIISSEIVSDIDVTVHVSKRRYGSSFIVFQVPFGIDFPKLQLGEIQKPRDTSEERFYTDKPQDRTVFLTPGASHNVVTQLSNKRSAPHDRPFRIRFTSNDPLVEVKPDPSFVSNSTAWSIEPSGYYVSPPFTGSGSLDVPLIVKVNENYHRAMGPVEILMEIIEDDHGITLYGRRAQINVSGPVYAYIPTDTVHRSPDGDKDNNGVLNIGDTLVQRGVIKNIGNMNAVKPPKVYIDESRTPGLKAIEFVQAGVDRARTYPDEVMLDKPLRVGEEVPVELTFRLSGKQLTNSTVVTYIVAPSELPDTTSLFEHETLLARCEQPRVLRQTSFALSNQNDMDKDGEISPGDVVTVDADFINDCGLPFSYQSQIHLSVLDPSRYGDKVDKNNIIPEYHPAIFDAEGKGGYVHVQGIPGNTFTRFHKSRVLTENLNGDSTLKVRSFFFVPENYTSELIRFQTVFALFEHDQYKLWETIDTDIPVKQTNVDDLLFDFDWRLAVDANSNGLVDQGDTIEYALTATNTLTKTFEPLVLVGSDSNQDRNQQMVQFLGYNTGNVEVAEGWYEDFGNPPAYQLKISQIDAGGSVVYRYRKKINDQLRPSVRFLFENLNVIFNDTVVKQLDIVIPVLSGEEQNEPAQTTGRTEFPYTEATGQRKCASLYQCHNKQDVRNAIRETALFVSPNDSAFCDSAITNNFGTSSCNDAAFIQDINHNFGIPNLPSVMQCEALQNYQNELVRRFDAGEETYDDEQQIQAAITSNMTLMLSGDHQGFCTAMQTALGL